MPTSSELALSVHRLSKAYMITSAKKGDTLLYEVVLNSLRHPLHRRKPERFDALRDVDFTVTKGETVGIIGRNGAGQEHAAQDPEPHHRADARASRALWADGKPARGRNRLPPRVDRS